MRSWPHSPRATSGSQLPKGGWGFRGGRASLSGKWRHARAVFGGLGLPRLCRTPHSAGLADTAKLSEPIRERGWRFGRTPPPRFVALCSPRGAHGVPGFRQSVVAETSEDAGVSPHRRSPLPPVGKPLPFRASVAGRFWATADGIGQPRAGQRPLMTAACTEGTGGRPGLWVELPSPCSE